MLNFVTLFIKQTKYSIMYKCVDFKGVSYVNGFEQRRRINGKFF